MLSKSEIQAQLLHMERKLTALLTFRISMQWLMVSGAYLLHNFLGLFIKRLEVVKRVRASG